MNWRSANLADGGVFRLSVSPYLIIFSWVCIVDLQCRRLIFSDFMRWSESAASCSDCHCPPPARS
ncbi:hypothetical protein SynBIOSE41_01845 [Synechococcus sp. BIOS-E4-1]|nr:hypothetical protein SynBIOSE41_01845 [Synechococcus sp. BIOS-E4-1]